MRFARIALKAFGHFQNRDVVFDIGRRVHVMYGPNEAGKSTFRRALDGFLFGIEARSSDTFRTKEVLIEAELRDIQDRTTVLQRRKGLKNTLLNAAGQPVPESALSAMLAGVTRAVWRTTFGLDHETLREEGGALATGAGEAGALLFQASMGGRRLRALIGELEDEAGDIFKKQGRTQKLNLNLAAQREAEESMRQSMMSPDAVATQRMRMTEVTAQREALEHEVRALEQRADRLARLRRSEQPLRELAELRSTLETLAHSAQRGLVGKAEGFARLLEQRQEAEGRISVVERQLAALESRLHELAITDVELRTMAEVTTLLHERDAYARDARRRIELSSECRARRAERERMAAALGESLRGEIAEGALVELEDLAAEARDATATRQELERALAACDAKLAAEPSLDGGVGDAEGHAALLAELLAELEVLLRAAEGEGNVAARVMDLEARVGAFQSLGALPETWRDGGESAFATRDRSVRAAIASLARAAHERRELATRIRMAEARCSEARAALDAFDQTSSLPSAADLAVARRDRDLAISRGDREAALQLAHVADGLTDAMLAAEREWTESRRLSRERMAADAVLKDLGAENAASLAQLEACWGALEAALEGVSLVSKHGAPSLADPELILAEYVQWFDAQRARRELEVALARARSELHLLQQRERELVSRLREASRDLYFAQRRPVDDASSREWLRFGRGCLSAYTEALQRRSAQEARLALLRDERASLGARLRVIDAESEQRERRFQAWLTRADLSPRALEPAFAAQLRALETARAKEEPLLRELALLESSAATFDARVAEVMVGVNLHARQGARGPLATDVALELMRRELELFEVRREQHTALVRERESLRAALTELCANEATLQAERAALVELTGLDEDAALLEALRAADRAAALRLREASIQELLRAVWGAEGEHVASEALAALLGQSLEQSSSELEETLEERRDALARARREELSVAGGLSEVMAPKSVAQDRAEELSALVAEAESLAYGFAVRRAARFAISAELERFRQRHQGPMLERAARYFSRLTSGAFERVITAWDDKDRPVIRAVRATGEEVPLQGLSEGSRDQLYLALRLAALTVQSPQGAPLPLVLDDALVHFDDARASAAFALFAEVAPLVEIIYLTHHEHIVGLAEAHVAKDALDVVAW